MYRNVIDENRLYSFTKSILLTLVNDMYFHRRLAVNYDRMSVVEIMTVKSLSEKEIM